MNFSFLNNKNGLVLIGKLDTAPQAKAVLEAVQHLRWPAVADITSQLRLTDAYPLVHYFDQLIQNRKVEPEIILHIGGPLTGKPLLKFVEGYIGEYIHVDQSEKPFNPFGKVTQRFQVDLIEYCKKFKETVKKSEATEFCKSLMNRSLEIEANTEQFFLQENLGNDIRFIRELSKKLTGSFDLFLSNSLPIRLMDQFAKPLKNRMVQVITNRGVSGIDGILATACGYAQASGRPMVLVIGDLAFLHDLNSLNLLRKISTPILCVILNNNGGGIFSRLPSAKHTDVFEEYFKTPLDMSFELICQNFGLRYEASESRDFYVTELDNFLSEPMTQVLEIFCEEPFDADNINFSEAAKLTSVI